MINDQSINQSNPDEYVTGIEDVKQCWWNILKTIPGSVPLMPAFGCELYRYVDHPVNASFAELGNKIISALTKWETRTTISKVTRTVSGSRVYLNIAGIYTSTGESVVSQIDLATLFGNIVTNTIGIGYDIIGSTNTIA